MSVYPVLLRVERNSDSCIQVKPAFVFASLGPYYPLHCSAPTEEKFNKKCAKIGAEQKVPCFSRYGLVLAESREMKAVVSVKRIFRVILQRCMYI